MVEDSADQSLPLSGLRVGISGAIPEREHWGSTVDLDQRILGFVSRLSGFVIEYGGTIVHGSHPALTPVIVDQAEGPDAGEGAGQSVARPLMLFASQFFGKVPKVVEAAADLSRADVVLTPSMGDKDRDYTGAKNDSLTAMRAAMADHVDVLVAIGGKLHRDTGFNQGVLEELAIMRWNRIPCFVVAGFGGLAGELESTLLHQFSDGNLLALDEVERMAMRSESGTDLVGILLAHFARHRDALRRSGSSTAPHRELRVGAPAQRVARWRVAEVAPTIVHEIAQRFARLKGAIESGERTLVGELLESPLGAEAKMDETVRVAHLQMIQGVITRMGSNSFSMKTASTTLVAALLAYYGAIPSASSAIAIGGAFVIAIFGLLDAYYLRLEKLFRALYDSVRRARTMDPADLYSMDITPFQKDVAPVWKIDRSWWTYWPYPVAIVLLAVMVVARPAPARDPAPPPPPASGSGGHT